MLSIRKRDGALEEFDLTKVSKAIEKAFMAAISISISFPVRISLSMGRAFREYLL